MHFVNVHFLYVLKPSTGIRYIVTDLSDTGSNPEIKTSLIIISEVLISYLTSTSSSFAFICQFIKTGASNTLLLPGTGEPDEFL